MPQVVGVKFSSGPKTFHYDTAGLTLRRGVKVVAESIRGVEVGQVTAPPREVPAPESGGRLKPVQRIATVQDIMRSDQCRQKEGPAYDYCLQRIRARELPMKLVDAFYSMDDNKAVLFFTAEGRVDFRELVKDLTGYLRTRVQLYQIGARDAARIFGGIGPCGQELCCSRWLEGFDAISMKMAKDQNLFLNPSKFSGVCGKLMCCLRYEHETYLLTRAAMPALGSSLDTPHGAGTVIEHLIPKESVFVDVPEYGIYEMRTPVRVEPTQPRCRNGGGCAAGACGNCGSSGCGTCGGKSSPHSHPEINAPV